MRAGSALPAALQTVIASAMHSVARGAVHVADVALHEGDGAAVTGQDRVAIQGDGDAEVLVFDLSMRH